MVQRDRKLTYIHRDDRTGLPSIPGIYIQRQKGWRNWFRSVGESQFEIRLPHWSCTPNLYKTLSTKNWNTAKYVHAECTDNCREDQKDRVFETVFLNFNFYKSRKTFLEFLLRVGRHGYAIWPSNTLKDNRNTQVLKWINNSKCLILPGTLKYSGITKESTTVNFTRGITIDTDAHYSTQRGLREAIRRKRLGHLQRVMISWYCK